MVLVWVLGVVVWDRREKLGDYLMVDLLLRRLVRMVVLGLLVLREVLGKVIIIEFWLMVEMCCLLLWYLEVMLLRELEFWVEMVLKKGLIYFWRLCLLVLLEIMVMLDLE